MQNGDVYVALNVDYARPSVLLFGIRSECKCISLILAVFFFFFFFFFVIGVANKICQNPEATALSNLAEW